MLFRSSTLTVQGSITADNISTPSTAATPSASISSEGYARFTSASIASFKVSEDAFFTDSFFISSSASGNDMFI